MLFTLLLFMLLGEPQATSGDAATSPQEAAQLERDGRYEEALAAFRQLAALNPNDHAARLAIARLHERMGHPDRAEAVFRSVALEDPANVQALLGVGRTLLAQLRPEDAVVVLQRAETIAPRDPDVLETLARAHRDAGRSTLALAYDERAWTLAPTVQHRAALERARLSHQHRAQLRWFGEEFGGSVPRSSSTDLALDYRLSDRLRVTGRGQHQKKFDVDDARGGAGVEWRWTPYTAVGGHALVGPGNDVMPVGDYRGEIGYNYRSATWLGAVRYFDFEGAEVTAVSPALNLAVSERVSLGLRYAFTVTDVAGVATNAKGHSAHVRGSYVVFPRITLSLGYARGVEDFDNFSRDRIGDFKAHTGSAGVQVDLPSLTAIVGTYEYQSRANDTEMQRLTVSLAQRF